MDPSFSRDGKQTASFGGYFEQATDVAALRAGQIVVVGTSYSYDQANSSRIIVASYKRNGKLDRTFGNRGVVAVSLATRSVANVVAVQPDGRIVVAGMAQEPERTRDIAIVRLDPDGSLDSSFGVGGLVTADFPHTAYGPEPQAGVDIAYDVAIQPDGRIVVAGSVANDLSALIRFTADGSLDSSFSSDGVLAFSGTRPEPFWSAAIEPDGRLLAAGGSNSTQAFVTRFLPDGSSDPSFSGDGFAFVPVHRFCVSAKAVAVDSHGRILVAASDGCGGQDASDRIAVLHRYSPNGEPDLAFGDNGSRELPRSSAFDLGLALDGNKPIIATGTSGFYPRQRDFLIARFAPNGKLDRSFRGGQVTTGFERGAAAALGVTVLGQRVVAVGRTVHAGRSRFAIAYYDLR